MSHPVPRRSLLLYSDVNIYSSAVLDAWLKGKDSRGWTKGPNNGVPAVNLLIRKGNPGFNSTAAEAIFENRSETSWPLERTRYEKFHLHPDLSMRLDSPATESAQLKLAGLGKSEPIQFKVTFDKETEIAGHPLANLVVGVEKRSDGTAPRDVDLFVTLRHFDAEGKEIFYTGAFQCASSPDKSLTDRFLVRRNRRRPRSARQGLAPRLAPQDRRDVASPPRLPSAPQLPFDRRFVSRARHAVRLPRGDLADRSRRLARFEHRLRSRDRRYAGRGNLPPPRADGQDGGGLWRHERDPLRAWSPELAAASYRLETGVLVCYV